MIKRWKWIELLKLFFIYHQKSIKKKIRSAWNFPQTPIQVCRGTSIPYFKIKTPFFCCSLFFEEYLYPQVRMVNKYSVNYHPYLSRLTSRVLNFYKLLRVLSLSRMCLIFSQTCTVHSISMVEKKFQNYGVEIHRKYIYESKTWM